MGISVLFAPLQNLLTVFQKERQYKDGKKDEALIAISEALVATKKYLEDSDGKKSFDRGQEYRLSLLWAAAAVKARYASADLAARLNDKSLYWSDELEWSHDEVVNHGIEIETIDREVRNLLQT